jgi:hypothetical protein
MGKGALLHNRQRYRQNTYQRKQQNWTISATDRAVPCLGFEKFQGRFYGCKIPQDLKFEELRLKQEEELVSPKRPKEEKIVAHEKRQQELGAMLILLVRTMQQSSQTSQ